MTDLFLQRNAVREATAFLLDALQDNKPEQAQLQTKVRKQAASASLCCRRANDFLPLGPGQYSASQMSLT